MGLDALRRIAGMEIRDACTFRRLRQKLEQDAARAPAMPCTAVRLPQLLGHCEPNLGRDLLGAQEIFVCRILQRAAVERDQALITVHIRTLIDSHREMPLPEQRTGIDLALLDRIGNALLVETRAG